MLADMADFWYITKTPNKTSQKHQTKQRKNTKQNTTKTPNSLLNKQEISIFATNHTTNNMEYLKPKSVIRKSFLSFSNDRH